MFRGIRTWFWRRTYREGRTLSRFIARDVSREVMVISAARIDEGIVTVRIRTVNLLYKARGLFGSADFGPAVELPIEELWNWTGASWGGLPDGTSIVDHIRDEGD